MSCIFSKMGTIMSNLGLLAGSSFMHSLISLHTWGEIPGGMVGRKPSRDTCGKSACGRCKGYSELPHLAHLDTDAGKHKRMHISLSFKCVFL